MDGPIRLGSSLALTEDVYSIAYVYQLRRVFIEEDFSDIEDELTVDKLGTSQNNEENK